MCMRLGPTSNGEFVDEKRRREEQRHHPRLRCRCTPPVWSLTVRFVWLRIRIFTRAGLCDEAGRCQQLYVNV